MRYFLVLGALGCGLAVVLGAFAAHGLKAHLSSASIATFTTGVTYQFYHSLGLLVIGLSTLHYSEARWLNMAGKLFIAGIILFSGSLYGLSLFKWGFLGPVTPLGGLSFIAGWGLMAFHFFKSTPSVSSS
ncbi:MAG: DUF423 domain-containing protein [Gammaproteobacteria bacterium]|nr:DUF423 domain-containing protein [Gammaproteobacteria bacterium]